MALTPQIRATQAQVLAVEKAASDMHTSQAQVLAVYNFPTEAMNVTQAQTLGVVKSAINMNITQAQVLAVVKGRTENRRLRAWGFTLDGHDFYVLRLGESETLVFDVSTGQWSQWSGESQEFWRAHVGQNWDGMARTSYAGGVATDIVAGDDATGLLWTLDPDQGYDQHPLGSDDQPIARLATGGVPIRMRETAKCSAVYLTFSTGAPALTGAAFTLRTSDDQGHSWIDHGTVTVNPGEWDQEVAWRSMGLIRAPGRIFELTDSGAAVRIDGLDTR